MSNILNPLTGTKVDGSTFTAAECNTVGANFPRCAVNDGQTDLQANASFSGGTTRSFGFVGLTTFGMTCSGTATLSAGAYAITVGAGGFGVSGTGSFAVTVSGASHDLALVTTDGDASLAALAGNVTITSGLDLGIVSGQDITIAPTGTCVVDAGKLTFTGTGYPTRSPAVSFSNVSVRMTQVYEQVSGSAWKMEPSAYHLGPEFEQIVVGAALHSVELWLSPNATYTGFSVDVQGGPTHGGTITWTKPAVTLYEVDMTARSSITKSAATTDTAASTAAYEAIHSFSLTSVSSFRPAPGKRYLLAISGESGSGALIGYRLLNVKASGSVDRTGIDPSCPIY